MLGPESACQILALLTISKMGFIRRTCVLPQTCSNMKEIVQKPSLRVRFIHFIRLYVCATAGATISYMISYWFYSLYVSTLWVPLGLMTLILILWVDHITVIIAVNLGLVTGCIIANYLLLNMEEYWYSSSIAMNTLFSGDSVYKFVYIFCDAAAIVLGGVGLSVSCGKDLKNMQLDYILSNKFYFIFMLVCIIISPASAAAITLIAEGHIDPQRIPNVINLKVSDLAWLWMLGYSKSAISFIYPGLVVVATFKKRLKKMEKERKVLYSRTKRKCLHRLDISLLILGDSAKQWLHTVTRLFLTAMLLFFAIGWIVPSVFRYEIEPSLLITPILSWVAWRETPYAFMLFDMFFTVSTATLFRSWVADSNPYQYQKWYSLLTARLFLDVIVTKLTAIFIMVSRLSSIVLKISMLRHF